MSNTASPAVARRRLRLALRSAREAKGLTQSQVADGMDWSLSKVMRIEKGEVSVAVTDLRILLDYLEIEDPGRVQTLINDARVSRQERYTIDPADRDNLTPAMIELHQFEAEAVTVRTYHNGPFELCDLDSTQSAFLYKEDGPVDDAVHAEDEINRHRTAVPSATPKSWTGRFSGSLTHVASKIKIAVLVVFARTPEGCNAQPFIGSHHRDFPAPPDSPHWVSGMCRNLRQE